MTPTTPTTEYYLVDVVEREARYVRDEDSVEGGGDAEVVCGAQGTAAPDT